MNVSYWKETCSGSREVSASSEYSTLGKSSGFIRYSKTTGFAVSSVDISGSKVFLASCLTSFVSSVWVFSWFNKLRRVLNFLLQNLQVKSLLLWTSSCSLKTSRSTNSSLQNLQKNTPSYWSVFTLCPLFKWTFSCSLTVYFSLNCNWQYLQENGFSPVWIFSWANKCCRVFNFLLQNLQEKSLILWTSWCSLKASRLTNSSLQNLQKCCWLLWC